MFCAENSKRKKTCEEFHVATEKLRDDQAASHSTKPIFGQSISYGHHYSQVQVESLTRCTACGMVGGHIELKPRLGSGASQSQWE